MRKCSAATSARPSLALDTHSLAESIQMQAFNRRGSTRYGFANLSLDLCAMDENTDLTSNPLTLEDLDVIMRQPDVMQDEFLVWILNGDMHFDDFFNCLEFRCPFLELLNYTNTMDI